MPLLVSAGQHMNINSQKRFTEMKKADKLIEKDEITKKAYFTIRLIIVVMGHRFQKF